MHDDSFVCTRHRILAYRFKIKFNLTTQKWFTPEMTEELLQIKQEKPTKDRVAAGRCQRRSKLLGHKTIFALFFQAEMMIGSQSAGLLWRNLFGLD